MTDADVYFDQWTRALVKVRELTAENTRFREALELLRLDVNEIDRMRTRIHELTEEVERLKARLRQWEDAIADHGEASCGTPLYLPIGAGQETER